MLFGLFFYNMFTTTTLSALLNRNKNKTCVVTSLGLCLGGLLLHTREQRGSLQTEHTCEKSNMFMSD